MRRSSLVVVAAALVWAISVIAAPALHANAPQQRAAVAILPPAEPRAVLDKYCVTCHNEKLKTAGLMLDKADVTNALAGAATWEKVIRKLRTGAMPPPGRPRPDKATY